MRQRLVVLISLALAVTIIGTVGYYIIGGARYSWIDALYMTVITIATIGYGEIIPLEGNPGGRIFTMIIAVAGIGVIGYGLTTITAFVVEGQLTRSFRRNRMEKIAHNYRGHYIICGTGAVGRQIAHELRATCRHYIVVAASEEALKELPSDAVFITGDATDSETLRQAGADRAGGLFAAAGDDNVNLIVSLTARSINPGLRILAECNDTKNTEKLKQAGADDVVSPSFIGGMRLVSEMVRPTVVSFLDIMLRDTHRNLRVEELALGECWAGKERSALDLSKFSSTLLLAVKNEGGWVYNPPPTYVFQPRDIVVMMTTPEDRQQLEETCAPAAPPAG